MFVHPLRQAPRKLLEALQSHVSRLATPSIGRLELSREGYRLTKLLPPHEQQKPLSNAAAFSEASLKTAPPLTGIS